MNNNQRFTKNKIMKKIGVIFTGYGTRDLVEKSLNPWIDLRCQYLGQFDRQTNILICGVSVKFAGFEGKDDGTRDYLRGMAADWDIDYLIDGPDNIPEIVARGMALKYLIDSGADTIIQWDSDEVTNAEELGKMLRFIDQNEFITSFRFSYKNLVFTPDQYLEEPFTPMRVHRVKNGSYIAYDFWDDNNIMYRGTITRDFRRDIGFSNLTIPPTIFNPEHWTWLSDERSKKKCEYQNRRWGHCSYKWDENKNELIFNNEYFKKMNLPYPKVLKKLD